ncbi:GntR family transcriptional regulator [Caballeronia hypogeia]|uniref:GntR family transcriptional regulator n=1 Tax=Caballeronia hypogeia TaxID=1777140 RepID=A0A158BLF2_9BURK|nr:GntR family transcriptional regulator [Caballeronia hypogeia]SAK70874.1 GntR family transcriptional regulator [Caballeronia hypogeia]
MKGADSDAIDLPTLGDATEERLRQLIISGDLEFGEQVTGRRLCARFGLSSTPVRQALWRLSVGDRLVVIERRNTATIFAPTIKDINDISAVRITLEQAAIRAATRENRLPLVTDLKRNIAASMSLVDTLDLSSYRALDHEFHNMILRHADNAYLTDCYSAISSKVLAMRNRLSFSREYVGKSIDEHLAITNALQDGKVDDACEIIARHVNAGFTERTRRLLADIAS